MTRLTSDVLDAAWKVFDGARRVMVAMHQNPDGDALGSAIALTLGLRALGKDVHLVCPQPTPEIYDFLRPQELIESAMPRESPELAVLVDCDRPERTGALSEAVAQAPYSVVLDHHPPTSEFGTARVTDEDCAATAEVVYSLLRHRAVPVSYEMAEALLTALVTDTGGFRYPNTRPRTLEIAADLMRQGPSTADIAQKVYDTRSLAGLKLMSRALDSIQLSPNGHVAWARLSLGDYEVTGAKPEDTEGFVNMVHGLKGVDVAVILREEAPGSVRVSFRSRGGAPVGRAAEALGGGGHELAAACVLQGTLDEAEQRVLEELKKWTEF
ncbi:MAG: DHH family phosphoesterase [Armatimonadota bacterium]